MNGKQKCAILKEIRRDIAKKNDINIRIDECTHKGECRGTCPRCEAEVKILERERVAGGEREVAVLLEENAASRRRSQGCPRASSRRASRPASPRRETT